MKPQSFMVTDDDQSIHGGGSGLSPIQSVEAPAENKADMNPSIRSLTLAESFEKYFFVELACTEKQRNTAYRIRYNVYCKEFGYESIEDFPDEKESDEYDDGSMHCLIIHKSSGTPAACVRLVPTCGLEKDAQLPFEKHCSESLDKAFIRQLDLDRRTVCEISRLAVDGRFRRRFSESLGCFDSVDPGFTKEERRVFPLIAVAALLAAIVLTESSGMRNMFSMMEPCLPRLLKRTGIVFQKAGKSIDYHGVRAPYFITTQSVLGSLNPDFLVLYQAIKKLIERSS